MNGKTIIVLVALGVIVLSGLSSCSGGDSGPPYFDSRDCAFQETAARAQECYDFYGEQETP